MNRVGTSYIYGHKGCGLEITKMQEWWKCGSRLFDTNARVTLSN